MKTSEKSGVDRLVEVATKFLNENPQIYEIEMCDYQGNKARLVRYYYSSTYPSDWQGTAGGAGKY